jgi:DNA-directed RNA polymerase subunit RPC12/RpoP
VPASEDLLFGKIALAKKFCTKEQIDECLELQATEDPPPPLGELLLYKGFITPEQHDEILKEQRKNLQSEDPLTRRRKEDVLFGKLAVREGLVTEEQVNEGLRLQASHPGDPRSLGEVMIDRGFLTPDQVKQLLAKQQKRIMSCSRCRLSFTVLTISQGRSVACPRCKMPLQEGKPSDSTRTDAEFATQVFRAVKSELPVHLRPDTRKVPAISPKKVKITCVICDQAFEGLLDATGRVRCPGCQTTFTPK